MLYTVSGFSDVSCDIYPIHFFCPLWFGKDEVVCMVPFYLKTSPLKLFCD